MKQEILSIMFLYFLVINLVGFAVMFLDKQRAVKNQWRIPEKVLFGIAIAFGSVGIHFGMKRFRHKTKHKSFVIGIPMIQILQIVLLVITVVKFK